jgi:hypothetical protein
LSHPPEKFLGGNKKTRLALTKRVFSNGEGKLDRSFESFARNEADCLRSLDFDLRAGLWIHASAGFAIADLECAEADELNGLCFFDAEFDGIDDSVHSAFCVSFGGVEGFLDCYGEFNFIHGCVCFVELVGITLTS